MSSAAVTIVITAYNQAAFVAEALRSALQQTIPCEVILADDGSTDDTVAIARRHRVRVLQLPHRGVVATYRAGVDAVATPFHIILNADDILDDRYVEATLPLASDSRIGFVYTGYRLFGASELTVPARAFDVGRFLWTNYAHVSSLTRTAAYNDAGGFDNRFSASLEDWALWVAMLDRGWRPAWVSDPLLWYRQHQSKSRNDYRGRAGWVTRLRLVRMHPSLYVRHLPSIGVAAVRSAARRIRVTD